MERIQIPARRAARWAPSGADEELRKAQGGAGQPLSPSAGHPGAWHQLLGDDRAQPPKKEGFEPLSVNTAHTLGSSQSFTPVKDWS